MAVVTTFLFRVFSAVRAYSGFVNPYHCGSGAGVQSGNTR